MCVCVNVEKNRHAARCTPQAHTHKHKHTVFVALAHPAEVKFKLNGAHGCGAKVLMSDRKMGALNSGSLQDDVRCF